jgi:hypothetical protein
LSSGALDTRATNADRYIFGSNAVFVVLLSASYTFFAYVVFGSQQSENTVLPFGDVNPAGHAVQNNAPLAEYVFTAHTSHACEPEAFLNLPASHVGHGPPSGPVYPGLQEQDVTSMLPTDEFELTGQLVQFALPEEFLYVPDGQIVHCPLEAPVSGPVYPALHRQATPHTGGLPYTCTSGSCKKAPPTKFNDNLRYRAVPSHM